MKDIIQERLNKIEDLEQRKILKSIMAGVFTNLVEYEKKVHDSIRTRVFNEIEDTEKKYNIYTTICHKHKVDPLDEFLHPMLQEDLEEKNYNIKQILEKLKTGESIKLVTIFLNCDYIKINEILNNKASYKGKIVTDKGIYKIEVTLKQNRSYMKKIEELYNIFQKNNVPWNTINSPYINKFFEVVLTSCEDIMEEEEIKEISFELGEYEKYKVIDVIPLWNVDTVNLKSDGFPIPVIDKVNFEQVVSLKKIGISNGYLVDAEEGLVSYIKHSEEELTIVSPKENAASWNVVRISQPINEEKEKYEYEYELASNRKNDSFINRFSKKQALVIRTKGEINRVINSFEISKYFQLLDIQIGDKSHEVNTTYDMNYFIIDEIRESSYKKTMTLKFKTSIYSSFIVYDFMSFLVSEIQRYFPEYKCEGELV
ncbi:normocyte-binding protein [Clostridium sp. DJ247]|uniref:normocyte-binding protein n=1 Tax=Clostridium sp. DJ247 TaxID=2726188 RepID=UPI00162480EE|nr:normocyte-binding protein [Clostridium sp. DJ247]MBC2580539.1 normocyte-binding protein [Clostridium sp. DJ247]